VSFDFNMNNCEDIMIAVGNEFKEFPWMQMQLLLLLRLLRMSMKRRKVNNSKVSLWVSFDCNRDVL
jgi:hypothetical protein